MTEQVTTPEHHQNNWLTTVAAISGLVIGEFMNRRTNSSILSKLAFDFVFVKATVGVAEVIDSHILPSLN